VSFSDEEAAYLRAQGIGRLATVNAAGQPDVVPVAVEFDGTFLWVGGGETVTRTRKPRNVAAGNPMVCLVLDDLPSSDPFVARGIRIDGHAEQPFERSGMVGSRDLHAHHADGLLELEPGRRTRRRELVRVHAHRPRAPGLRSVTGKQ
jgi:pyridoxamine 5'-phosphate oxidase family protein